MENNVVELERQVQIFLHSSDLCLDVCVHLTLIRVILATMIDNAIVNFPVLCFTYFSPDLVLNRETHLLNLIPLNRLLRFFIHLNSLLF